MYIRCTNKSCEWEQDDFHNSSYNTRSRLKKSFSLWGKPGIFRDDPPPHGCGNVFTWAILIREIIKVVRQRMAMKWVTLSEYREAQRNNKACCPKCNQFSLTED